MRIPFSLYRLYFTVVLQLLSGAATAQTTYGNDWIKHDQTYYKIKITQTGLYQLNHDYLNQLGLAGVNPQNLQLFRRGKEVAIHVAGEADGKLDQQDYVEFYGERNDGVLDQALYKDPAHQMHKLYSLYTDTAAYFLTVAPTPGKRMQSSNLSAQGKTPEPYHLQRSTVVATDFYYRGKDESGSQMPWMGLVEGYMSTSSAKNPRDYKALNIKNVYNAGQKPELTYIAYAMNNAEHEFIIRVTDGSGKAREVAKHSFYGFGFVKNKLNIEFSDISTSGTVTVGSLSTIDVPSNQIGMVLASVAFQQQSLVAGNHMHFYTDSTRSINPYFEFSGASATTIAFDVTDPNNIVRVQGNMAGSKKGYVINADNTKSRKVLLSDVANPLRPVPAEKIKFRNINPAAHNYLILTNKQLMATAAGSALPAPKEYAAYRASLSGGKYDTLLVYIDDIVNQFHYGEVSTGAVRNFLSYMRKAPNAKHLLILGKGIEIDRINYRNAAQRKQDLVLAGGSPGSDNIFSADFRNGSYVAAVPTGRVSVTTPEEIISYLNKVKEYEAADPGQPWRKNILQLGGGTSLEEITSITNHLQSYKRIGEGPFLGANVKEHYRKNVSEVVETINVSDEVNAGLSLVTFFGHSSSETTDLDIGYASSPINGYNNKGKYPVLLMNGCGTGSAFNPNHVSFGEDWIKTPNRGAIAYIAHIGAGDLTTLHRYSRNFYTTAFQDEQFYGRTIGQIHQEAIKRLNAETRSPVAIALMLEMLLQGDPAIRIYSPAKPDYHVLPNNYSFSSLDSSPLTAITPEFILKVNVGNWGKAITDSVYVAVKRTLPDNTEVLTDSIKVGPVYYEKTLNLKLSNLDVKALGMNRFEVIMDHPDKISELDEGNNIGSFRHYFPASGLVAMAPLPNSIVSDSKVNLVVQPTAVLTENQAVYFEVDTTHNFNSNYKKTFTSNESYLQNWEINLPDTHPDSTVYFWRARFQQYEEGEDTLYAAGSFRHIKNSGTGWSQGHIGQYKTDELDKIQVNEEQHRIEFAPLKSDIEIRTIGGASRFSTPDHNLIINGRPMIHMGCSNPAGSSASRIIMVVLNNKTLKPVENLVPAYACGSEPFMYDFGSLATASNRAKIETFINAVPDSFYVVAIGINNVPYSDFTTSQKAAFGKIGSKLIQDMATGYPFAIVGQKGTAPGSAKEMTAILDNGVPANSQYITLKHRVLAPQDNGVITSTLIGPALSWGSLHHNIEKYRAGNDNYTLSLIGVSSEGNTTVLAEDVTTKNFNLSDISTAQYPLLKLQAAMSDVADRSAPQLENWTVLYEPVPEGIIRPDLAEVTEQLVTEQANKGMLQVPMIFQNITPVAFKDSLVVEVTLTGDGIEEQKKLMKLAPLAANSSVNFTDEFNTLALEGTYKLSIYVNPRLQPEQHYFNNIYVVPFRVKPRLHPTMDVAFDGIHILDGELISPTPLISITMKDENRYAHLQDASGMSVVLVNEGKQEKVISLETESGDVEHIEFHPATENSDFRVEFKPKKFEAGRYTMEVRGRDVAGKQSGISPYRINFEVDDKASITNFYPFPNPFSTKTHFVFTLTGTTIPDHIKIQILTITGKVVKEIMKEELGPLRIGNNKTEYAWDGSDMYGDKLANGVYLYRVVISQGTEPMLHKQKFGDKAFKNGYGKIYILR